MPLAPRRVCDGAAAGARAVHPRGPAGRGMLVPLRQSDGTTESHWSRAPLSGVFAFSRPCLELRVIISGRPLPTH